MRHISLIYKYVECDPCNFTSSPPDMVALGCGDNAIALIGGLYGCLKKMSANYVMSQSV